ncbi:MAG: hypothetical protein HY701_13410 [Gemmatimonadetes bacterium]|nr:hypothetical protein [Gemmatimonadota bacterium]
MIRPAPVARSKLSALLLTLTCGWSATACYTYHAYQVGGPGGRELGNQPATEWEHRTLHAFAWGAIRQDATVDNCRLGSGQRLGMEEVRVDTNFGYLLAAVVTLGIWVPLEVSWRCARPPVPTDTLR